MKAYEDEVERLATIFAEKVCTKIGYEYEKEPRAPRICKPRAKHESQYCEACALESCPKQPRKNLRTKIQ